ncbi:DNA replication/repair protein RecF [Aureimonas pseudogalii]|uniref:DNA replication and repair protein RecF n=1 Tax=Aureimonas pseudogalii TaxID=1744844 RepID=A0A7W6EAM9_9HYPH|nr:DNA replication/repair protein RecF [Aureimonas pseudogalii]MBB3997825.1 DNA replication and repair protein RecF [Aureimonas pseudogalii]
MFEPADDPRIRIRGLGLVDFRNYGALSLPVSSRFVVLHGDNGSGKTNLLEAVSLLSPGRGLRRAAYGEIARGGGSGGFSVRARLGQGEAGVEEVLTLVRPDEGAGSARLVRLDGTQARTVDELLDHLRVVWLTPAMDGLFTGPAGDRRRFLDRMVLTVDPGHGRRALDYEKAMKGRNRLLADDRTDDGWLAAIEAQMAELGLALALARADLVARLKGSMAGDDASPFPTADLTLHSGYEALELGGAAVDLEDAVAARLRARRFLDRAAGRTTEGPHRCDLDVRHREKAMPAALASTGEQKALLIGLVVAHARLVEAASGMAPVLLLDEIAAHLDPGRRAALFDILDRLGVQSFLTGTDAALFEALEGRAEMFTVHDGTIA